MTGPGGDLVRAAFWLAILAYSAAALIAAAALILLMVAR